MSTNNPRGPKEALLRRYPLSFQKPLDLAIEECRRVLLTPANRVRGAEATLRKAHSDYKALVYFQDQVAIHLRNSTFQNLPQLRHKGYQLTGVHKLICGPFRGIFLVSFSGDNVVAIDFSREPHSSDLTGP